MLSYSVQQAPAPARPTVSCPLKGQESALIPEHGGGAQMTAPPLASEPGAQAWTSEQQPVAGTMGTGGAPVQTATGTGEKLTITCKQGPPVATTPKVEASCCAARIHFAHDSAELDANGKEVLDRTAKCLTANPQARVSVIGHTDETGTPEYNQALGERRADAIISFLTGEGVRSDQLRAESRGQESPLCEDQSDVNCRAVNRRVEVRPESFAAAPSPGGAM
jgi:peptidoglycan-associated lipoprotein